MNLINWNESLLTGIPLIDSQHKGLVDKINSIYTCMENGSTCEHLQLMLESLLEYTYYHFETEERFFTMYSYPDRENHLSEHKNFKETINNYLLDKTTDRKELGKNLLIFLNSWLIHHIIHIDMEYSEFLIEKMTTNK